MTTTGSNSSSARSAMKNIPYTERANEFSENLDGSCSSTEFLHILRSCDQQIFNGYKAEESLFNATIIKKIENTALQCSKSIKSHYNDAEDRSGSIVITGCGTSGRLAYLTSRRYSELLKEECTLVIPSTKSSVWRYAIAGGDSAILLSDELPEDDPQQGVADMQREINQVTPKSSLSGTTTAAKLAASCLIGVTCGISAPYVAGQVLHGLGFLNDDVSDQMNADNSNVMAGISLVGFNPVNLARNGVAKDAAIELDRYSQLSNSHNVLNPIIGPVSYN